MEETDIVMANFEQVSQKYVPLAASCSSIYFTIEGLSQVHFLYQFWVCTCALYSCFGCVHVHFTGVMFLLLMYECCIPHGTDCVQQSCPWYAA